MTVSRDGEATGRQGTYEALQGLRYHAGRDFAQGPRAWAFDQGPVSTRDKNRSSMKSGFPSMLACSAAMTPGPAWARKDGLS